MKFDGYYLHFVLLPFLSLLNVKPIHSVCVCIFFLSIFRWRAAECRRAGRMMKWWNWAHPLDVFLSLMRGSIYPLAYCGVCCLCLFLGEGRPRGGTWNAWWTDEIGRWLSLSCVAAVSVFFLLNVYSLYMNRLWSQSTVCVFASSFFLFLGERRPGVGGRDVWWIDEIRRCLSLSRPFCFSICGQAVLPPTVCVFVSFPFSLYRWRAAGWRSAGRMMNWWNWAANISILCCCRFCLSFWIHAIFFCFCEAIPQCEFASSFFRS